jgi:hypothetical protein
MDPLSWLDRACAGALPVRRTDMRGIDMTMRRNGCGLPAWLRLRKPRATAFDTEHMEEELFHPDAFPPRAPCSNLSAPDSAAASDVDG